MKVQIFNATPLAPAEGLWLGSAPRWSQDVDGFGCLVLCARENQPPDHVFPHGVTIVRVPLDDVERPLDVTERRLIESAAERVAPFTRSLITCVQGLNRSALVMGYALLNTTGMSGHECAELIKSKRLGALSNAAFDTTLRAEPARERGTL